MVKFIILFSVIFSVKSNAVNRVGGWGPPPPTTVPPTTLPATEAPPSGWGPPSSTVSIALSGELAASGPGWAAENHAENIQATGGWGVTAEVLASASGESVLAQDGSIIQASNIDSDSATSLNAVSIGQIAEADEGLAVIASGLDVLVGQSGWAGVAGEAISVGEADTSIIVDINV